MKHFPVTIARAILLTIVLSISGCIWLPALGALNGVDAGQKVGEFNSKRPLRPEVSNRDDLIKILGKPTFQSWDKAHLVYRWDRTYGVWWSPLFFLAPAIADKTAYAVEFELDSEQVVQRFSRHQYKYRPRLSGVSTMEEIHAKNRMHTSQSLFREFGNLKALNGNPATLPFPAIIAP